MQEGIEQRYSLEWPCGGADHWTLGEIDGVPVIEYVGDVDELHRATYNPLSRPKLCENLGALGATASRHGALPSAELADLEPDAGAKLLRTAAGDREVQEQALAFVRQYGPPERDQKDAFFGDSHGRYAFRVDLFVWQAVDLNDALRLATKKRLTASERHALLAHLEHRIYFGLRHGVRFTKEGLTSYHVADSLISAAWLQLLEARAAGGKGFRVCKDPACGQMFAVQHKNEKYHSERCRNRHTVEQHRAAKRRGSD